MSIRSSRPPRRGFTLIELMVTIAIAAILLAVAVPGFLSFQRSSAVFSAATSFASALNIARVEAIKRNLPTFVKPVTGNDWTSGWTVFVDANSSGTLNSTDPVVLQQAPLIGVSVPITTAAPGFVDSNGTAYVRYDASGNPNPVSPLTMTMPNSVDFSASAGGKVTTRRVNLTVVGRARTCDPNSTTNLVCP